MRQEVSINEQDICMFRRYFARGCPRVRPCFRLCAGGPKQVQDGAAFEVVCTTRSPIAGALERLRQRIATVARLCGARVVQNEAYPGWAPQPDSTVVNLVKACCKVRGAFVTAKRGCGLGTPSNGRGCGGGLVFPWGGDLWGGTGASQPWCPQRFEQH